MFLKKGAIMDSKATLTYSFKDFIPLISLFTLIGAITLFQQWWCGWNAKEAMRVIMASFFLIFGFFKVINLSGFVQAYSMYDLVVKQFAWYAYLYPFIELALGCAYLFKWQLPLINWVTLVLMIVSAAGVFNELRKGHQVVCACLGAVFKVPMTYVTLVEDLIMAAMAAAMIFLF